MPHSSANKHRVDGFSGFERVSSTTLNVALHDLRRDPTYTTKLIGELAQINPDMALAILAEAREAGDRTPGGEIECLRGAFLVIAAQVKQQRAESLEESIDLSNVEYDGGADQRPAA